MDVLAALHASSQLELETVQAVNAVLSECWSNTFTIQGTDFAQDKIKGLAGRLRKLLDNGESTSKANPPTYHEHPIDIDFM